MSNRTKSIQRTRLRATHVASVLFAGAVALAASLVVPVMAPAHHGGSVHAKNAATPDWIVERQTLNAQQMPVVIETDEPSFWI
jgi:hypothetical protein